MTVKNPVISRECRFATHLEAIPGIREDTHVIKEILHYKDGTKGTNLSVVNNFERPFWITKQAYRNHKEKKEWEELAKVQEFKATQSALPATAGRMVGLMGQRSKTVRDINNNPYIYGTDITSTAVIKKMYKDKYPDVDTPYTVSAFDTETDMLNGTEFIIMASIAMGNKVYTSVTKDFVKKIENPKEAIKQAMVVHIPDKKVMDNLEYEIRIVDSEMDVVRGIFKTAHKWGPDFMAIWNIDFDINKVTQACDRAGVDPADIFSDPSLEKKYRYFKYMEGRRFKKTEEGKFTPISPEAQWHTTICPAKFYPIDAMSAFNFIRLGQHALIGGYSLDNVLSKKAKITKLKFSKADKYKGGDWHIFMQKHYPIEYIVYNQWDCISMLILDDTTTDLSVTLPTFSGISDFGKFNSDPGKIIDAFHYHVLEREHVLGGTPRDKPEHLEKLLGLKNWIK